MTQDHSSKLSFSIEESVWLNKGQEVDEIVSLSLDPEITVEENGEYVLIRGGLKLTGEYRSNGKSEVNDEESLSLSNQVEFRSIEEVTLNEDGTGEIRHNFPIDVTIPQERINSLDDIYVLVESFDYDLPDRGCIQLTADVAITGMSTGYQAPQKVVEENNFVDERFNEEVADESEVNEEVDHVEEAYEEVGDASDGNIENVVDDASSDEERTFHYESYNEEENVENETVDQTSDEINRNYDQLENDSIEEAVEEPSLQQNEDEYENRDDNEEQDDQEVEQVADEVEDEVEEVAEIEHEETPAPSVSFGIIKDRPKQEAKQTEGDNQEEEPQAKEEQSYSTLKSLVGENVRQKFSGVVEEKKRSEQEVSNADNAHEDHSENEVAEQVDETKPPREENALYLTKMLTKGEGEEFKKLKMCIIQEDETLNTIAERYEINPSTLIRVNRLNDSNVEEGQILYIPVTQ
ncbi:stage VI sporulation protein D [Anaerobacillus arseniciselenatis]|uniref:Stage VI sporulation protein D n=1 Tax=Anaerobacillus arseniciselenatis TaxID=85682 RepID=A0A1S2LF03_9BACI|nr:stage VI sporulation protein D [Anaerobacillus arseniciselenatis]OIJ10297.1 stage VI sporulation protein D [Anaerobacillus arseniciselenatis]